MLTDVTKPRRTEQRIAERMQQHIPIGMRDDTLGVRYAYPAKHHVIARPEGVNIKP
jgi:hypothetical protein